jgi:hypothetical protein
MPKLGYVSSARCKPSGKIGDYSVSFNVYRATSLFGPWAQINPALIAARAIL